jgi:hypothetical protein
MEDNSHNFDGRDTDRLKEKGRGISIGWLYIL